MKKLLGDRVLKQDRFKVRDTCSEYKEIDEYNNHQHKYFLCHLGKYIKFFINGTHTRGEAYRACVRFARRQGYSLTKR